jgi:hypothetical protein
MLVDVRRILIGTRMTHVRLGKMQALVEHLCQWEV